MNKRQRIQALAFFFEEQSMCAIRLPRFVVEYTPKTIAAVLSPAALAGENVEIDVYERLDAGKKFPATGRRLPGDEGVFRVTVSLPEGAHEEEMNYTLVRESAGRSRKAVR